MSIRHYRFKNHFQYFHFIELNTNQNKVWKGLWVPLICEIWSQINKIIFKQRKVFGEEIFCMKQLKVWL